MSTASMRAIVKATSGSEVGAPAAPAPAAALSTTPAAAPSAVHAPVRFPAHAAAPAPAVGGSAASARAVADAAAAATSGTEAAPTPAAHLAALVRRQLPAALLAVVSIGLLIGFWYLATKYRWQLYIRFTNIPSPGEVFHDAARLLAEGKFLTNIVLSLQRIVLGFAAATVLGVGLGLVIGRYRLARRLLFPALEVLRPIPAIAWVPISIMLWPTTETSIVFITFIGAFFPILLNTMDGVAALDDVLLRAARCLGASELALMTQVVLRGAMPHIFTGLAVGMGVAWVSLIAAEMISGQFGIGYFTWEAYSLIEYAHIVIGMIVIGVLGLACSGAIRLLAHLVMPWHAASGKGGV